MKTLEISQQAASSPKASAEVPQLRQPGLPQPVAHCWKVFPWEDQPEDQLEMGDFPAFSPDIDIVDVKVSLLSYSNPGRWEKVETAKPTNLVAVRDVNIWMYDDVCIIISLYGGVHKWGYP